MNPQSSKVIGDVSAELEQAWNDAYGSRWGEAFSDDADLVNIQGVHIRGSAAIANGHQGIFDSIYKGSTVHYSVVSSEPVAEGCLFGVIKATLEVPAGPLQGVHPATISVLVVDGGDAWRVRSFHNTLVTG
jgi:uncharacterized protein (TIGR02246 family)